MNPGKISGITIFLTLASLAYAQSPGSETSPKWTGYNIIASGSFVPVRDYPWFILDETVVTYWLNPKWGIGFENQVFPLFQFTASGAVKFRERFFLGAIWNINKMLQLDLYGFYQQVAWYGTHLPDLPLVPIDGDPANGFEPPSAAFYWNRLRKTTHDLGIQPNLQIKLTVGPLRIKNKNRFQMKFVDQTFDGDHFAIDYINETFAIFLLKKPPGVILPNIFIFNQLTAGLTNGKSHEEMKFIEWLNIGPSIIVKKKLQISLMYSYRYDTNLEDLPGGIGDKFVVSHGALFMVRKAF